MITGDLDLIYYFNPCEPWSMFLVAGIGLNSNKPENAMIEDATGSNLLIAALDG